MIDLGTLGGTVSDALAVNDGGQVAGVANLAGDTAHHAVVWTLAAPVVTLTAPSPVVTFSAGGGPVSFTVSSTAGTPACTADGSPFVSGGVLSLGAHMLVCTATDPVTHLTGTASASVIVVLSGPPGPQGPAGPAGPPGPQGPANSQLWNTYVRGHLADVFTASTFTPDGPITITRIQVQLRTAPKNCNVDPVIQVSQGATVKTITLTALANDSGAIAVNFAAASPILVGVSKSAKGCGIDPANANVLVQYKGQ